MDAPEGPEVDLVPWRGSPGPLSPASSSSSSSPSHDMVAPLVWSPSPMLHLQAVARHLACRLSPGPTASPTPRPPQPPRRQSDFSIARILSSPGPAELPAKQQEGHFEWLHCTRYRPPKLPRTRRRDGPAQRRLGRNPRIPFSSQQVSALEARFRRSHYLSSADVAELSSQLQLSETRVKIWFQNRRARERRDGEGRTTGENQAQGQTMVPGPSQLPRSPLSAFTAPQTQRRDIRMCSPEMHSVTKIHEKV